MPITVMLMDVVRLTPGRDLWPASFAGFIKAIEKESRERTTWGACADWLKEEETDEPIYADAFRFVADHPGVQVYKKGGRNDGVRWGLMGLPAEVERCLKQDEWYNPAQAMADLAQALPIARDNLKKQLEALS